MIAPSLEDRTAASNGSSDADNKKRKASLSQAGPYGHYNQYKSANTSMVKSKFLTNPEDLGVVAVGFSGGQVCNVFLFATSNFHLSLIPSCLPRHRLYHFPLPRSMTPS